MRHRCCLLLLVALSFTATQAQIGKRKVHKLIHKELRTQIPQLVEGKGKMKGLNIDRLRIGRKRAKLRGEVTLRGKNVQLKEPLRFRGRVGYSGKKIGVQKLRVSVPGDRFLGFRRYRRLV